MESDASLLELSSVLTNGVSDSSPRSPLGHWEAARSPVLITYSFHQYPIVYAYCQHNLLMLSVIRCCAFRAINNLGQMELAGKGQ